MSVSHNRLIQSLSASISANINTPEAGTFSHVEIGSCVRSQEVRKRHCKGRLGWCLTDLYRGTAQVEQWTEDFVTRGRGLGSSLREPVFRRVVLGIRRS